MLSKIIGGALLAVLGGVCNGSWLVPTKETAPAILQVSSPSAGLPWEAFWFVFMLCALVLNCVVTVSCAGAHLFDAISNSPDGRVVLVCFFFLIWGFGTTGFGLAIKRVGVALGTALVMAVVVVVGTALPLTYDFNASKGQAGFIIAGVAVSIFGFTLIARASYFKDLDQAEQGGGGRAPASSAASSLDKLAAAEAGALEGEAAKQTAGSDDSKRGLSQLDADALAAAEGRVPPLPAASTWLTNVLVCVAAGVSSAMLQFGAFYGKRIRSEARAYGMSEFVSGMPVWFLGIAMCVVPGLAYAALLLTRNRTWRSLGPGGELNARRLVITAVCALLWVASTHIYGLSTAWLGDLGGAVAWPLLLTSTILTASVWSGLLKEWRGVQPRTMRLNWIALSVLVFAVLITAAGVFYGQYH